MVVPSLTWLVPVPRFELRLRGRTKLHFGCCRWKPSRPDQSGNSILVPSVYSVGTQLGTNHLNSTGIFSKKGHLRAQSFITLGPQPKETDPETAAMEATCQCGAVKFQTPTPKPLALYICHCHDCQRQSSSAFGTSAIFPRFPLPDAELLSCYRYVCLGLVLRIWY